MGIIETLGSRKDKLKTEVFAMCFRGPHDAHMGGFCRMPYPVELDRFWKLCVLFNLMHSSFYIGNKL